MNSFKLKFVLALCLRIAKIQMIVSALAVWAISPAVANSVLFNYAYDSQNRLIEAFQTTGVNATRIQYSYDAVGNMTGCTINSYVDSDGDGISDDIENSGCTDAHDTDSDDDGLSDGAEDLNKNGVVEADETDPCNIDTDGDGIQDGTELGLTLDGVGEDTDRSVFRPDEDPLTTTDPIHPDSDRDGKSDGEEDTNKNGKVDPGETDPNRSDAIFLPIMINNSDAAIIYLE